MQTSYVFKRIGLFFVVLWGAATLNFIIPRLAPGDPVRERLYEMAAQGGYLQQGIEQMVKAYDQQFGLDQPLYIQYFRYLWDTLHLDFGYSLAQYPARVLPLILAALPWTIGLLAVSTLLAFAVGTILGALISWPKSPKFLQYLIGPLMTLSSIPYYLFGLILIYLFAISLKIFPLSGGYTIGSIPTFSLPFILDILHHAILPALSMILAEAKGLKEGRIFFRYAVRNAILPQFTSLAIALGHVVSGSVLVEVVFGFPGIGTLLYKAISGSDYFVIYGVVFIVILAISLATLLIDLVYPLLDPRITYRSH